MAGERTHFEHLGCMKGIGQGYHLAALPWRKGPWCQLNRRLDGSQHRSGRFAEYRNILLVPGIELHIPEPGRYTDHAVSAPVACKKQISNCTSSDWVPSAGLHPVAHANDMSRWRSGLLVIHLRQGRYLTVGHSIALGWVM
jgi:hypothetical protein